MMLQFYVYSVFVATFLMVIAIILRPHAVRSGDDLKIFLGLCFLSPVGAGLALAVIGDEIWWRFTR